MDVVLDMLILEPHATLLHHTVIDTLSVLRFIVSFRDDRHERQFIIQW